MITAIYLLILSIVFRTAALEETPNSSRDVTVILWKCGVICRLASFGIAIVSGIIAICKWFN